MKKLGKGFVLGFCAVMSITIVLWLAFQMIRRTPSSVWCYLLYAVLLGGLSLYLMRKSWFHLLTAIGYVLGAVTPGALWGIYSFSILSAVACAMPFAYITFKTMFGKAANGANMTGASSTYY